MRFGPQELVLILLIVLLLFGATRLPKLARSLREARDEFQKGSEEPAPGSEPKPATPPDPSEAPSGEKPSENST